MATAQEEEAFGLRRGDSVIHLTRIAIAERPVEVNFIRMPAVRFELVYELPAH
jgi:DNA-binding GntR family transcriptional regulator